MGSKKRREIYFKIFIINYLKKRQKWQFLVARIRHLPYEFYDYARRNNARKFKSKTSL